jgi:hypothetical protein
VEWPLDPRSSPYDDVRPIVRPFPSAAKLALSGAPSADVESGTENPLSVKCDSDALGQDLSM